VALSMVITLIPGFGGYSGGGTDTVVAEIGGEPLSILEVSRGIQNAMRGRQMPPGMMPHMVPAIVDSMIT